MPAKPTPAVPLRDDEARLGLALVLVSAVAYAFMPVLTKVAYAGGAALAGLLAWRFLAATLLFSATGGRGGRLALRQRVVLWALGFVFVFNAFCYFTALETVPASTVALLLYTYPVIVTLLAAAFGVEPLSARGLGATALSFAGAALTAGPELVRVAGPGVLAALGSAAIYALYIVLGGRYAAGVPAEVAARHVAQACAAIYLPWAALRGELLRPLPWSAWAAILAIAVVCTVLALRTFLAGLARVGPTRAAVASTVEVVVSVALAVALLGESVGPRQLLGGGLILGAVLIHNVAALRRFRRSGVRS
jgi:drug/metabolite transporter (DMT)-like permease